MAKEEVKFYLLQSEKGTTYKGGYKNEMAITHLNAHQNSYFNIDMQQSAYFTMKIEGFDYGRFHSSLSSVTQSYNDGRRDYYFNNDPNAFNVTTIDSTNPSKSMKYTGWQDFTKQGRGNASEYWLPLKSLQYSQGSIETMTLASGTFSDIQLPFRKHSPTLTVEMYDHRSDFFEMKLREWHSESVLNGGFVPVLESITKKVTIRGYSTNGDCNSVTVCDCILADDIVTTRGYDSNELKVIQFKLVVVGY